MAFEAPLVSALPATDQLVLERADIFFTRGTGILSLLIRFFTRGIGESRHSWLILQAVFLLTLLPSQAGILSAQSEKDIATLTEAEALCQAGRVKKAQKKFNKLIKRFPTWSEPLYQLGVCQHRAGQFQQVRETFEKVLSMDPGHEGATRSLILDSLGLRDSDHAVDLIEASIRKGEDLDRLLSALSPRFAEGIREDLFYRPIARLFLERKLWDGALTLLDLWETDLPDSAPEAMARRGWVYLQTDQFQQARETFEKLSPQHQAAKRSLDLLSNLDLVAYGEIFNSVINREHDHAVDLIEASIQRGEDPDRILRALVASSFPIPGFYFFGPVTDRLIERKSWDLALARIMQKI